MVRHCCMALQHLGPRLLDKVAAAKMRVPEDLVRRLHDRLLQVIISDKLPEDNWWGWGGAGGDEG